MVEVADAPRPTTRGHPTPAATGSRTSLRSDLLASRPPRPAGSLPTHVYYDTTLFYPTIPAAGGALPRSTTMAKPPVRKPKKKVCLFCQEKIVRVDYKDT